MREPAGDRRAWGAGRRAAVTGRPWAARALRSAALVPGPSRLRLGGAARRLWALLEPPARFLYRRGRAALLARLDPSRPPIEEAKRRVEAIRTRLHSLGLTDRPLAELRALEGAPGHPALRAFAARELALWALRPREPEGCREALAHVALAREGAPDRGFRSRLVTIELMAHHVLGQREAAQVAHDRAAAAGELDGDALLAWANHQPTPELRLNCINEVLARTGIAPVALGPDASLSPYDRLTAARPLPPVPDGPKVTVLMAAFDAASTIGTALRSLQEQTWRNLEILVLDDASPTDAMARVVHSFAAADPRIRLIRMPVNAGAYVARNRALEEATGEFVTVHDADDWSHPQKIERQARHLVATGRVMGCTSEQARACDDLIFRKLRPGGGLTTANASSFLFRREPIRAALGCWDTVRFGADNELIRRMQRLWGPRSLARLATGSLSFQRDAASSVTADPVRGVDEGHHYYGVRREYFDAQRHFHAKGEGLRYGGDPSLRPFPVPPMMLPRPGPADDRFDVIFAGEFRRPTPEVRALAARVAVLRREGLRVGLVEAFDPELDLAATVGMCAPLRDQVDGDRVRTLVYGEEAWAARLERVGRGAPLAELRFAPRIHLGPSGAGPADPAPGDP